MKKTLLILLTAALFLLPGRSISGADSAYDAVVIGAGGGGLAAAARMSLGGMKVLLIEQHYKVGGYMTNFERDDYTFEVSLHAMDGLDPDDGMNIPTFTDLGIIGKVKPIKLDPMYLSYYPDFEIVVPADVEEYRLLLKEKFPHEAEGIDGLYKDMEDMKDAMVALMDLAGGRSSQAFATMMRNPAALMRLPGFWRSSLADVLDKRVSDPKFIAVFTQLAGFAGASPGDVPAIFFGVMWNSYHKGGYYYFEGGSQAVSDAMAEVIEENGGEILLSTKAVKIEVEDGKAVAVQTEDGGRYPCRYVVSNANAPDTLFKMVGKDLLPADYVKRVESMKVGLSCFQVYMGVDHDYSEYFTGGAHEIMVNTGYDQEKNFQMYKKGDPENSSFAIVNYSIADPSVAPAGKSVIVITAILPYDYKDGWHEAESYAKYTELKNEVAMVFVRRAEKILPGLEKNVEVMEVGSPRTMEHFTLNPGGSIFGWDNIPEQSLLKRLEQKTPIKNLYLAGAWTFPGGGQSGVLVSGLMAANKILKAEGKKVPGTN